MVKFIIHNSTNMRTYILSLFALLLLAACGDDVIHNHYYPQEPETPEQPQEPSFERGEWLTEARSPCYYGLFTIHHNALFPAWLLQAKGIRYGYPDSEFVQECITDDISLELKNPGTGTLITLRMDESPVCHASEYSINVPQEESDETLDLEYPVKWNVEALLAWHADRPVDLSWTLLLDGEEVQHYTHRFNCRSLHCFSSYSVLPKEEAPELITEIKKMEFGDWGITEDEEVVLLHNFPFLMGYIDEHSPFVEELKHEVVADGYLPYLTGQFSPTTEELLNCTAKAFNYLMMKHHITYGVSDSEGGLQYLRTIDDIFRYKQAYCMELAVAFASWCMNQGVECTLESVPSHMCNSIIDKEKKNHPADMTIVASNPQAYTPFANPPTPADFEKANRMYQKMMEAAAKSNEEVYEPGWVEEPLLYASFNPLYLRSFLPSFNIGSNYAHTRALLGEEEGLRFVKRPGFTKTVP